DRQLVHAQAPLDLLAERRGQEAREVVGGHVARKGGGRRALPERVERPPGDQERDDVLRGQGRGGGELVVEFRRGALDVEADLVVGDARAAADVHVRVQALRVGQVDRTVLDLVV